MQTLYIVMPVLNDFFSDFGVKCVTFCVNGPVIYCVMCVKNVSKVSGICDKNSKVRIALPV